MAKIDDSVKKKVPELRFPGFTDDWEERKLGDISYKVKEKNKTGEFTETLTNSAEYGIINQRDFFDKDISNAKKLTGYYVVKNDDFVYNPRISNFAPVGPIKRNKLGRTGVMSPLYYVFRTHDIDKNYFEKYFDTVYWHRFMELNGDSGARADRFAIKDSVFVEMPIPYPTMDEQQKIGSFFKQIDDTIALHQRKLDLLKEQKKGYLKKMFPKNGAKVPELRFAGFADDWEERKFDECFNFPVSANSLSRALLNYDEGDIQSVHYGDILIKYPAILNVKNDKIPYITDSSFEKYKSNLLENGDLIFADAAEDETVGKAVEVNGLTEENLVAGLHTIVARSKDKKAEFFLGYYINSNTYHRQLLRLIQGSKVSSISKGNLQKTLVSFPKDFEEQQKIGAFFKKIDDTLALHQRKLDFLKEQKKGLLQKMFV
ncbi:restriction endonuclease subunit S [Levilactobacillus brevis]|uniref:restriction endonuclease subunit S n=1 Tax=Levilactobacillus brevis TaxID=1580 RepID=UPI00111BB63B|nr:restriction endonuclease subunit S [Levilactobacillus brevis]QCZ47279.1 deoxyribonuclease [Levilactobacillus brevis]